MKLWLFKRKDKVGWDEYDGFVVRAETAKEARKLLLRNIKETYHTYIGDPKALVVTELCVEGDTEVILASFNAG